jgi:mono/diheme cytochrome c family protein
MNQIKHLLFACLVLVCIVLGFVFVRTIYSAKPAPSAHAVPFDDFPASPMDSVPANLAKGRKLFTHSCAPCHSLNKTISAPALHGVTARGPWGNRKNLYDWVRDPASFMAKNLYTKRLKEEYGYVMTAFPALTDDDIEAIINYVESGNVMSQNMPVAMDVNHQSPIVN